MPFVQEPRKVSKGHIRGAPKDYSELVAGIFAQLAPARQRRAVAKMMDLVKSWRVPATPIN